MIEATKVPGLLIHARSFLAVPLLRFRAEVRST
jgi:hypothetical protein